MLYPDLVVLSSWYHELELAIRDTIKEATAGPNIQGTCLSHESYVSQESEIAVWMSWRNANHFLEVALDVHSQPAEPSNVKSKANTRLLPKSLQQLWISDQRYTDGAVSQILHTPSSLTNEGLWRRSLSEEDLEIWRLSTGWETTEKISF